MVLRGTVSTLLLVGLAGCARARPLSTNGAEVHLTRPPNLPEALAQAVMQNDAALFRAVFDECDPARAGELVTDDFEFFHDKGGRVARSRDEFVADLAGMCERQAAGTDFKARRELLVDTVRLYPLGADGVAQTGSHRFYARMADGHDKLTETAQFLHVWLRDGESVRLARVVSYDHQLAQ